MNEVSNCCGTTCDKAKLKADQSRVVDAFDKLYAAQEFDLGFNYFDEVDELKAAIAYLREKQ